MAGMHFTDDTSVGHEVDGNDHERHPAQVSEQHAHNGDETWPLSAAQAAGSAAIARLPRVSLFSPGVPAMSPMASPDAGIGYARATPEGSPTPTGSSRPLSSLAAMTSMTKRTSRLKLGDDYKPIVQLQTQIPSAQKSGDDPSTPLDTPGRKRTTIDLVGSEYATINSLSGLFAGGSSMNSRAPSYNQATGPLYLRASNDVVPLPDHLYTRGLLEGRYSDISVIAFGKRYDLHRLILDQAPFFTTALSEPWIESQAKEVTLYPEKIDHGITQAAFELAIRKIYGVDISKEIDAEAIGLFATGCWLEMQHLVDLAIESILRQMVPETLAPLIRLVTANYYGRSGERILESAKAMLSRNGWEMPLKNWDDMPGDIIRELVGSDGFFVDSEWDRWVLAKRLLDRRLRQVAVEAGLMQRGQRPIPKAPQSMRFMAVRFDGVYRQNALTAPQAFSSDSQAQWLTVYTNPDVERLLVLLDEGIHYIHMEYEQLEYIRTARDAFGLPVLPERVISNALWQQLALRQKVLNADESSLELGLCQAPQEPETTDIPPNDVATPSAKGKQKAGEPETEPEIESESWDGNGKPRKFWIPSTDCNIVLGNGADPVVTTSNTFQRHATRLSATIQPEDAQWATDFASTPSTLANPNTRDYPPRPVSAGGSNAGQPKSLAYSEFPPFRFAAEFPNPRFLKEKKRVYSRTVSYAGSLWNIYIQKVRSAKNVQLGVYLHRAKDREVDETTQDSGLSQQTNATVDSRIGQLEREMLLRSERRERRRSTRVTLQDNTGDDDTSGSGGDPESTLVSTGIRNPLFSSSLGRHRNMPIPRLSSHGVHTLASPSHAGGPDSTPLSSAFSHVYHEDDDTDEEDELDSAYLNAPLNPLLRQTRLSMPTLPSFVDARPTIRTYFKIYSPSKGGRMLSIYESAPDKFNFSQSWGWKSSTLMLDEVMINGTADDSPPAPGSVPPKRGDGKLRFMVVIGNL
ncbi:hypothetical protein C7974DRAFT_335490 [Boeremia exigua]|uniref:uncharacterized protein n=1 Tax=Boeremia exigua TaxID=749465 RepID=UPI001E8EA216|nr:uncharacterized protein C7974DRAFT_335490 [Boeremia exigua]KAH6629127.1 hypothetical protein C7974DRAFT_335490 [Boeremia exigua]